MSWMTKLFGMLVVVSLAACAAQAPRTDEGQGAATKDGEQVSVDRGEKVETAMSDSDEDRKPDRVCERIKRTGSHMTETFCYSRSEQAKERARAREEMRREVERSRAGDR